MLINFGERTTATFVTTSYSKNKRKSGTTRKIQFEYQTNRNETFSLILAESYGSVGRGNTTPILYRYTADGISANAYNTWTLFGPGLLMGGIPLIILLFLWYFYRVDLEKRGVSSKGKVIEAEVLDV